MIGFNPQPTKRLIMTQLQKFLLTMENLRITPFHQIKKDNVFIWMPSPNTSICFHKGKCAFTWCKNVIFKTNPDLKTITAFATQNAEINP
jgi:hypothetical protein